MTRSVDRAKKKSVLVGVLENQFRALVSARAEKEVIDQFSTLISILKRHDLEGLERRLKAKPEGAPRKAHLPDLPIDISNISLSELLALVANDETPRKYLERIATTRFGVPQGSMRSFSNRRMLVDKLRSLIRNEQAHETIGILARHHRPD